MTKKELEKAIENGESVWFADNCNEKVWEIDLNEKYKPEIYLDQILYVYKNTNDRFKQELFIENIFKTKAEAEHYLHHANVERIEKLPFLTWEEFLKEKYMWFVDKEQNQCCLYYITKFILINKSGELIEKGDLTEANFYKAYDECVRLFRSEE